MNNDLDAWMSADRASSEGVAAAYDEKGEHENPYPQGSMESEHWRNGWRAAYRRASQRTPEQKMQRRLMMRGVTVKRH